MEEGQGNPEDWSEPKHKRIQAIFQLGPDFTWRGRRGGRVAAGLNDGGKKQRKHDEIEKRGARDGL